MKFRITIPSHYERSPAFLMRRRGCALEDVRAPVYLVSAPAVELRALRLSRRMGLTDAARKLGIRALELAGLERGHLEPEELSEWSNMTRRLK
jgi:hypothetical protein